MSNDPTDPLEPQRLVDQAGTTTGPKDLQVVPDPRPDDATSPDPPHADPGAVPPEPPGAKEPPPLGQRVVPEDPEEGLLEAEIPPGGSLPADPPARD
jgi:hypothetical protein